MTTPVPRPPEGKRGIVLVPAIEQLSDEHFMRHLELRHSGDLAFTFTTRPGQEERTMDTRLAFESLHALRHRQEGHEHDHEHKQAERWA